MSAGIVEELPLDGLTVHIRRWEPARPDPRGVPTLLVHGLGANTVSWVTVGQALADRRGAPVIALDLAGFGYTRAIGTEATVGRNADLVIAALERFGPAVVTGNSMGGAITVKAASRRTDLVEAFVLVNPAVRPAGLRSPQVRNGVILAPMLFPTLGERLITSRAGQLGPEGMVDGTLEIVLERAHELDPEVRERFIEVARDRMEFPEAARAYADAAASLFWYMSRNLDRDLATTLRNRPGLLVFGERDRLIHVSSAHALARRHPRLDVEILDGVGHAPQLDAPGRFVDVVAGWLEARFGQSSTSD
jgi:pimeloyl-ACP methyl ester carboxylesterase